MQTLASNDPKPLYRQIADIIASKISSGEWKENDRLPSEYMLMKEFNCSRVTVRAALSELSDNGLIIRSHGRGTFVAASKSVLPATGTIGFTRSCQLEGKKSRNDILSSGLSYPSARDVSFFGIDESRKVVDIRRLRYVDGQPCVVETLHVTPGLAAVLKEDLTGSVTDLLSRFIGEENMKGKEERTVDVCYAYEDEAEYLNIESDTPLLLIEDRQYTKDGMPLFWSKQVFYTKYIKLYL